MMVLTTPSNNPATWNPEFSVYEPTSKSKKVATKRATVVGRIFESFTVILHRLHLPRQLV